jgi:hypothetical protein
MKSFLLSICVLFVSSFAFSQSCGDGFVSLFDGKTLEGWKVTTENPASFSVENCMLIVKGGRAHIFYDGEVGDADFKNFELKLKARTTAGSNSGVYFHTKYQEEGWPDLGFEAQVNSTHSDAIKTGSLWGVANIYSPKADEEPPALFVKNTGEIFSYRPYAPSVDGEWFDYHIIVQDNRIIVKVNGKTTVDWEQPADWAKKRRIGHGTIGLQAHDPKSEVHYKDIQIKILE